MEDPENVCRVCGSIESLEMIREYDEMLLMINIVMSCVIKSDQPGQYLCGQCISSLEESYNFKSSYMKTCKKFRKANICIERDKEQYKNIPNLRSTLRKLEKTTDCDNVAVNSLQDRKIETSKYLKSSKTHSSSSRNATIVENDKSDCDDKADVTVLDTLSDFDDDNDLEDATATIETFEAIVSDQQQEKNNKKEITNNNGKAPMIKTIDNRKSNKATFEESTPTLNQDKDNAKFSAPEQHDEPTSTCTVNLYTKASPSRRKSLRISSINERNLPKQSAQILEVDIQRVESVYKCEKCSEIFSKPQLFKKHQTCHLHPDIYKCKDCGKQFKSIYSLKRHSDLHSSIGQNSCGKSEQRSTHKVLLANRYKYKSIGMNQKTRRYKCGICKKSFLRHCTLRHHKRLHVNRKSFNCKICNKAFTHSAEFKAHVTTHEHRDAFKCEFCNKTFAGKAYLKIHQALHENPDIYKCDLCKLSFCRLTPLKDHKALHENPDIYKCLICHKSFTQKKNLNAHKDIHINPDAYKCEICMKTFSSKHAKKIHKLSHLSPELYEFRCEICNRSFCRKDSLKSHQVIHTISDVYKCEVCNKSFKYKRNLRAHSRKQGHH